MNIVIHHSRVTVVMVAGRTVLNEGEPSEDRPVASI